jgi:hypothetical protein
MYVQYVRLCIYVCIVNCRCYSRLLIVGILLKKVSNPGCGRENLFYSVLAVVKNFDWFMKEKGIVKRDWTF